MKWTVKPVAEVVDAKHIEHEIATTERADGISPATVGLTIAEGKRLLESLRKEIVTAQVQQHGVNIRSCPACGSTFRTKGHYRSGASFCLRKGWHVYPAAEGMSLLGIANAHLLHAVHKQEPDHARVAVSHRQDAAVNEIVAKRMVKKQQMRWNRHTVQSFLDVRIHVLNGTLENAFRHWHQGFRPIAEPLQVAVAA